MAPTCPEEVDVFSIPHSRMKELVNKYLERLMQTNFDNEVHLTELLESLCLTFREFIAHEQIENKFIMKKLKNRLKALSIQNSAVCNCHKDNQLIDMLNLFEDGYKCTKKSYADRVNYGLKLRQALEEFTRTFLPHMAEEEQVFQPLLMQHFSVEELKQIKATVLQQHFRIEPEIPQEKFVEDNVSAKDTSTSDHHEHRTSIDDLSNEMVLQIFSYLNPQDLCRTAQVSKRFNNLAMDRSLWTNLFPVSWANGNWEAKEGVYEEEMEGDIMDRLETKLVDEDADVDESNTVEDWDAEALAIQRQSFMLTSMCKYLLPRVGVAVQRCDLAYSKGLTNGTLYKILSLCPNLEYLNLTQTRISDLGFKGLDKNGFGKKLKHLDLTGCLYITDLTLERLSPALHQGTGHITEPDLSTKNDGMVEEQVERSINEGEFIMRKNSAGEDSKNDKFLDDEKAEDSKNDKLLEDEKAEYSMETSQAGNGGYCQLKKKCCNGKKSTVNKSAEDGVKKETEPEKEMCCQNLQRHETCCQNTPGCANNNANERKVKTCKRKSSIMVNTENKKENKAEKGNNITGPEKMLKRLIKCVCCGKVDEIIDGREKEKDDGTCYEERSNYHGNQNRCCHGRASVTTDRCDCHFGKEKHKKDNTYDKKHNLESKSCCTVTHGCHGTSALKGQGNVSDYPCKSQENVVENPETKAPSGEYGYRTKNDDFPDKFEARDQKPRSESDMIKDTSELENLAPLENQIPLSDTNTWWENSWALSDLDQIQATNNQRGSEIYNGPLPIQTEIPLVYIMNDLDLKYGMENPAEITITDDVTLVREEGDNVVGPPLEFLGLSGCYEITDVGLSYLSEKSGLPNLKYLDLSGCLNLTGPGITKLVDTCSRLDPSNLFYCDNILDGPYPESASGCQNLQCTSRMCCRSGE